MQVGKVDIPGACKVCGANLSNDSAETCGSLCAGTLKRRRFMQALIGAEPGDRAIVQHKGNEIVGVLVLRQSHGYFNAEAIGGLDDIARIRNKIATGRVEACGDNCPGWAVFNADSAPELDTCIDCWSGATDPLTLDEVEALPEAEHELQLAVAAAEVETDSETLLYKHPLVSPLACECGCFVFQVEGGREKCSACGVVRLHECHCDIPGSCDICKPVGLLTLAKMLREVVWREKEGSRDSETVEKLSNLLDEADEIIAMHEDEAKISDQPADRDSPIFIAALAAMDRAEEINGPEGDDYRRLMRAIEVEARTRRLNYDKE